MPLTPLILRFNGVNAGVSPVQLRWRRYFSGSTANVVKDAIFQVKRFDAPIFQVKRC